MLTLHSIEAPPTDIPARAVQTLVTALDDPDRAAAVADGELTGLMSGSYTWVSGSPVRRL